MIKLDPHSFLETATQETLLGYRDGVRDWAPVLGAMETRFAEYRAGMPLLSRIPPTPAVLEQSRDDLLGIYDSGSNLAEGIRRAIRKIHELKCPYCGEASSPTQIDHFLPKADFPEFALFSQNLIPSCDGCNLKKNKQLWDSQSNVRKFLNPFLDEFLSHPFFYFAIIPDAVSGYRVPILTVAWDPNFVTTDAQRKRCEDHFNGLDVVNRARTHVLHRCDRLRHKLKPAIESGTLVQQNLVDELLQDHAAEVATNSTNSRDAVTFRSIVRNPEFLDFICTVPINPAEQ